MSILKRFKFDGGSSAGRIFNHAGSGVLFLWAALCGLIGQLLRASGWGFIGVLAVAAVVIVSFTGFVVISAAAIIGAVIAAAWTLAARLFAAGKFLLQWAAV